MTAPAIKDPVETALKAKKTAKYPEEVREDFRKLDAGGFSDYRIHSILAHKWKEKLGRTPPCGTLRRWRKNDAGKAERPDNEAEITEAIEETMYEVEDKADEIMDHMAEALLPRLEAGELKDMDIHRLADQYRKWTNDKGQRAENKLKRRAIIEAGISPYQQIMINIQQNAEAREKNGSSDTGATIIDVPAEQV